MAVPVETKSQELVAYETLDEGRIARIWLNRPQAHCSEPRFARAARRGVPSRRGRRHSPGGDLGGPRQELLRRPRPGFGVGSRGAGPGPDQLPSFRINGSNRDAVAEKTYLQEWHYFFENTCRWRDLRKITIAQVQGNAISAGLMLIWACD